MSEIGNVIMLAGIFAGAVSIVVFDARLRVALLVGVAVVIAGWLVVQLW